MNCKHCKRPITLDRSTYWVHAESDLVSCGPFVDTCAEPSRTER